MTARRPGACRAASTALFAAILAVPLENHLRDVADFPHAALAGRRQADCLVGQASRFAAVDADEVGVFGLARLVKRKPPDVIAQVDADRQTHLGQIVQAPEDGRRTKTGRLQPLGGLGVRQRSRGSGQQLQDRNPAGRLLQAGSFQQRPDFCGRQFWR